MFGCQYFYISYRDSSIVLLTIHFLSFVSFSMKAAICIMSLLIANFSFASSMELKTRFTTINIQQEVNDKFSLLHQHKQILVVDGKSLKQEAVFRFAHNDIILLRFFQSANSRFDKLAFMAVNKNGTVNVSPVFEYPANVPIEVKQKDDLVVADLGIERYMHNYISYDGSELKKFQKGAKASERLAEPIPDSDCNKLYNNLYVPSFNKSVCDAISYQINKAFEDTVEYKAMSVRSNRLDKESLIDMANKTCQTKSFVIYNDFKTKVCGYSTLTPDANKLKNYAKD